MTDLTSSGWEDYQLLDTGNGLRLEQFGNYTVVRPDANVLWEPTNPQHPAWNSPDVRYTGEKPAFWVGDDRLIREGWSIGYADARFRVKPTPFRHMGLFPEQAPQWELARKLVEQANHPKVLNLFAYTGAVSIILAQAGAQVCHVDASKGSIMWAKENARLSGLPENAIRWIVDDVPKFLQREVRRGNMYDLILMDPPVFGRGPQGEIWRLEEQIAGLAELTGQLLTGSALGLWVNFYATALYPESIRRVMMAKVPLDLTLTMVGLQEKVSQKVLQTGFCLSS